MTPAERAARATSLGASEVPTIAHVPGCHGSELLVWGEKLGYAPRVEGEDLPPPPPERDEWFIRLGNLLEEPLAQAFEKRTGLTVRPSPGRVVNPSYRWMSATPDRVVEDGAKSLLEIKKRRSSDGWGEDGSDIVAPSVFCQVQWQLMVCRAERAYVAALFGGVEFRHYLLTPDESYQKDLFEIAGQWWQRHVVGRKRPPIDGSEETRAFLQKWHAETTEERAELTADGQAEAKKWAGLYASSSRAIREAEKIKDEASNNLRGLLGSAALADGDWGTATLKTQRIAPPWKEIACALDEVGAWRLAKERTRTTRVLRVKMKGGDDDE